MDIPQLQYDAAGLVSYVHRQLGFPIVSTAPLGKISNAAGRLAPLGGSGPGVLPRRGGRPARW